MKHGECVNGELTEQEKEWSESILKTWTNFAIHGYKHMKKLSISTDLFNCNTEFVKTLTNKNI